MAKFPLLKDMIDRQLVEQIAARLTVVHPEFDAAPFVASVLAELDALALKARHQLIAAKLREYLPAHYPSALRILLATLDEERGFAAISNAGLRLMAIPCFIERYGLAHPAESLDAMPIITRVSSCEFAVRPYIANAPTLTMARLREWANSGDEHLRRLASEGSRPRLPWGAQLVGFLADPTPSLALLERLEGRTVAYMCGVRLRITSTISEKITRSCCSSGWKRGPSMPVRSAAG